MLTEWLQPELALNRAGFDHLFNFKPILIIYILLISRLDTPIHLLMGIFTIKKGGENKIL